jgi:hypothetical protein
MFRLTRVIVRLRSEPFGFSSIITYSFLFWRLLVGVKLNYFFVDWDRWMKFWGIVLAWQGEKPNVLKDILLMYCEVQCSATS